MSKKVSIVPNSEEHLAALGLLNMDKVNEVDMNAKAQASKLAESRMILSKISNHFVFGNHGGLACSDNFINKTSNNKLDQSYKISYADMCDILKSYKSPLDKPIEIVNIFFQKNFFLQWSKLMK
jgi:hypothetical protein